MSLKVEGLKKLETELEKRFGKEKMQQISDQALSDGADVFIEEFKSQFSAIKDKGHSKGHTISEITKSEPLTLAGTRTIKIHWRGPHDRYKIIHLNEFGTVKNPNPPAKGVIARALKNSETAYREAIKQAIERGM